jgi:predicted acylesterase/phospholipase RssA
MEKTTPPIETPWTPDTLVLGPGGIRGFMELGALLAFEQEGHLNDITTVVGVSVGALIGLLFTAGLTVGEIIDTALHVDFFEDVESIIQILKSDKPYNAFSRFPTVRDRKGLLSNDVVKKELQRQLIAKFGFTPSLHQLYLATGIKFIATSMNLRQRQPVYLSYETDPDLSVIDAVLLSMNIPLIFYQLRYKGDLHIDGAFANPYPVDLFRNTDKRILGLSILSSSTEQSSRNSTGANANNSDRPDTENATTGSTAPNGTNGQSGANEQTSNAATGQDDGMVSYLMSIIYSTLDTIRDRIIRESDFPGGAHHLLLVDRRSLSLDVVGMGLDAAQKTELVVEGYHQGLDFLDLLHGVPSKEHGDHRGDHDSDRDDHQGSFADGYDPRRPPSIVIESADPIPLLSAFLAENPIFTGALLAMSTGQGFMAPANHRQTSGDDNDDNDTNDGPPPTEHRA